LLPYAFRHASGRNAGFNAISYDIKKRYGGRKMAKKTWNEKLTNTKDMPKIEDIGHDNKMAKRFGEGRMLIAAPSEYDQIMKQIPEGKVVTTVQIREFLAKRHGVDFTCPLTAGIFVNIAANASRERGGADETPYWRTLKKDGELCEKYPDGIDGHRMLLEMENHTVVQKGKRYFVQDYEQKLHELT